MTYARQWNIRTIKLIRRQKHAWTINLQGVFLFHITRDSSLMSSQCKDFLTNLIFCYIYFIEDITQARGDANFILKCWWNILGVSASKQPCMQVVKACSGVQCRLMSPNVALCYLLFCPKSPNIAHCRLTLPCQCRSMSPNIFFFNFQKCPNVSLSRSMSHSIAATLAPRVGLSHVISCLIISMKYLTSSGFLT
jgi:hypothetical protein